MVKVWDLGLSTVYFISLYLRFVLEVAYIAEIPAWGKSDALTHVERCHFSGVPVGYTYFLSDIENADEGCGMILGLIVI